MQDVKSRKIFDHYCAWSNGGIMAAWNKIPNARMFAVDTKTGRVSHLAKGAKKLVPNTNEKMTSDNVNAAINDFILYLGSILRRVRITLRMNIYRRKTGVTFSFKPKR